MQNYLVNRYSNLLAVQFIKIAWMQMIVTVNVSPEIAHNDMNYTVRMLKNPLKYLYFCENYDTMCNNVDTYF